MIDLDELGAYEEIRQLVARYALAVDMHDVDLLAELFVDDVKLSPSEQGREALRRFLSSTLAELPVTFLQVGGHVINLLDAETATGSVHCRAEIGSESRWIHQLIVYKDRYERRGSRWLFRSRDHQLIYGAEVNPNPLLQPAAEWPQSQVGRGTIPQTWEAWRQFVRKTRVAEPWLSAESG